MFGQHILTLVRATGETLSFTHTAPFKPKAVKKREKRRKKGVREQTEKGLFSVSRANTNNGLRREVLVGAQKAAVCLPRALDSTRGIFGFTKAEQPEALVVR